MSYLIERGKKRLAEVEKIGLAPYLRKKIKREKEKEIERLKVSEEEAEYEKRKCEQEFAELVESYAEYLVQHFDRGIRGYVLSTNRLGIVCQLEMSYYAVSDDKLERKKKELSKMEDFSHRFDSAVFQEMNKKRPGFSFHPCDSQLLNAYYRDKYDCPVYKIKFKLLETSEDQ